MRSMILSSLQLSYWPDWQNLSERTLYRRAAAIRDFVGKTRRQPICIQDLAAYMGLETQEVQTIISGQKP